MQGMILASSMLSIHGMTASINWVCPAINVPLFKKLRDIIFFCGTITLWAISRDILRGPKKSIAALLFSLRSPAHLTLTAGRPAVWTILRTYSCPSYSCLCTLALLHCKDKIPKFRNKYSQKRNIRVSVSISTFMRLWAIYIFPQSVSLFCWRKYVDRTWDYINHSQAHECWNWSWGRAIPRKGIHKGDFPYSVVQPSSRRHLYPGPIPAMLWLRVYYWPTDIEIRSRK
jgi:hypothetical protein